MEFGLRGPCIDCFGCAIAEPSIARTQTYQIMAFDFFYAKGYFDIGDFGQLAAIGVHKVFQVSDSSRQDRHGLGKAGLHALHKPQLSWSEAAII